MNGERLKTYRFANAAQWRSGLFDRARLTGDGVAVASRLGEIPVTAHPDEVRLVAVSRRGEVFWVAGDRLYLRSPIHDETCIPNSLCDVDVPSALARADRLVAWRKWLWAIDRQQATITRYDAASLQEAATIRLAQIAGGAVGADCDIAPDGEDGVWALVGSQNRVYRLHTDVRRRHDWIDVPAGATRLTTLGSRTQGRVLVLLDPAARRLHCVAAVPPHDRFTLNIDDVAPTFVPVALGGNGADRILLAGEATRLPDDAGVSFAPPHRLLLVLDESGLVDYVDLGARPQPPTSSNIDLAGLGETVWIADSKGLRRFAPGTPSGRRAAVGRFMTPLLTSPEGREKGWLRAELVAELPPGAILRVRYASTDSISKKDQVAAIAADDALPQGVRRQRVHDALQGLWSEKEFVGEPEEPPACGEQKPPQAVRTVPLHAAPGPWLWLEVELQAAGHDRAPLLRELRVRYPELSLMRHLPAIYRSDDNPDSFLRRIVAVLEATTQDFDERIERLGALVDPATAPAAWLDFLGTWLGLPWHDDLPEKTKRALLGAAAALRVTRGTRAGILALLRCLLPGRRVRIVDSAVDLQPIIIGAQSGACATTLPAVLLGRPNRSRVLGSPHAVLGHIRLPCPGDDSCDPLAAMEGRLRIEITASAAEQKKYDPVLRVLLRDFVPLGIRHELHWRPAAGASTSLEGFVLDGYRPAILDRDAVLGRVTLSCETSGRLRPEGLAIGFELQ